MGSKSDNSTYARMAIGAVEDELEIVDSIISHQHPHNVPFSSVELIEAAGWVDRANNNLYCCIERLWKKNLTICKTSSRPLALLVDARSDEVMVTTAYETHIPKVLYRRKRCSNIIGVEEPPTGILAPSIGEHHVCPKIRKLLQMRRICLLLMFTLLITITII